MASVTRVFFDTSVFVYGLLELNEEAESRRLLAEVSEGSLPNAVTAWHCCLEFFAVTTRLPNEARLLPSESLEILKESILAHFEIVDLPAQARVSTLEGAVRDGVAGGRLYDFHLAETARHAKAGVVVTGNLRHFQSLRVHGIEVLSPAGFVTRLDGAPGGGRRPRSR